MKFELTHFDIINEDEGDKGTFRFDFYHPDDAWLSWKKNSNGLPDFAIDYSNIRQEQVIE